MTDTHVRDVPAAMSQAPVQLRLEVVVIPVADYDRAKAFYTALAWRLDGELNLDGGYRLSQFTPPGSTASIIFGTQTTSAQPGSFDGLVLVVDDIKTARDDLLARGVEVSDVFHDVGGTVIGGFHIGDEGRAPGPDPEGRSYASYVSFNDSEGNRWVVQEITERFPGRV
jgi:catechol 2,3-dioxygenase-like lactoylglutathione lyase family enzyme